MAGNIPTEEKVFTACSCKNKSGRICGKCMRDIQILERKKRRERRGN